MSFGADSVQALNALTGYPSDIPQCRMPASLSRTGISTHCSSPTDSANTSHPFLLRKQVEMRHNLHTSKKQQHIQRQLIHPQTYRVNHVPVGKTIPSGLLVNPAGLSRYPDITLRSERLHVATPAIMPIATRPHVSRDIPRALCSAVDPLPTITARTRVSPADSTGHAAIHRTALPRTPAEPRQGQSRNQGSPARHRHRTSFPGPLRRSSSLHRGRPRPPPAPKISLPTQLAFRGPPVLCRSNTRAKGRIVKLANLGSESTATSRSTSTTPPSSHYRSPGSIDRTSSHVANPMSAAPSYFSSRACESESPPRPLALDVSSYLEALCHPAPPQKTPNNGLLINRAVTEHYPTIQYASISAHRPDRARETWKKLAELGMVSTPLIAPEDLSGHENDETPSETYQHDPLHIQSGGPSEAHYARLRRLRSPRTHCSLLPLHPDLRDVLSVLRSP